MLPTSRTLKMFTREKNSSRGELYIYDLNPRSLPYTVDRFISWCTVRKTNFPNHIPIRRSPYFHREKDFLFPGTHTHRGLVILSVLAFLTQEREKSIWFIALYSNHKTLRARKSFAKTLRAKKIPENVTPFYTNNCEKRVVHFTKKGNWIFRQNDA